MQRLKVNFDQNVLNSFDIFNQPTNEFISKSMNKFDGRLKREEIEQTRSWHGIVGNISRNADSDERYLERVSLRLDSLRRAPTITNLRQSSLRASRSRCSLSNFKFCGHLTNRYPLL